MAVFANLQKRLTTAAVLIGLVVLCLLLSVFTVSGRWSLVFLSFLAAELAAWEFARICAGDPWNRLKIVLYFFALGLPSLLLLVAFCFDQELALLLASGAVLRGCELKLMGVALLLSFLSLLGFAVWSGRQELRNFDGISREGFLGLLHIGMGGACLLVFPLKDDGARAVLWLLLVVIANDAASYFAGSKFQGPKLAAALSPGKTVSGALGGLAAGILIGVVSFGLFPGGWSKEGFFGALLISLLAVIAAQLADLAKSYVKRLYGVKDSGTLLPGHGGVLDRIDGLLGAAPIVYLWGYL